MRADKARSSDVAGYQEFAGQILSAYCSNNQVDAAELPGLVRDVHAVLVGLHSGKVAPEARDLVPAVRIKRSVFPDYIVCLEDGKKLKMLKWHLYASYGMTPQEYRERWGSPPQYPMVAPNYAEKRSMLARQLGLGRKAAEEVA